MATVAKFEAAIAGWRFPEELRRALLIVALHLHSGVNWDSRSDILMTKLLGALFSDRLRSHLDGIYHYANGGWRQIEEVPEPLLREMEKALASAQSLYILLMHADVPREWDATFDFLSTADLSSVAPAPNDHEFNRKHWAASAGREMGHIPHRFTGGWLVGLGAVAHSPLNKLRAFAFPGAQAREPA